MRNELLIVVVLVAFALVGTPAAAQSVSELLERGIYNEETAGNLDRAVEIYGQIVDDATAHRLHVAEALFRTGMCQLKKDDAAAATEAFERIIASYPDQEHFVALARANMPDDPGKLDLSAAPWLDGEVHRMSLKLASGAAIGTLLLAVDPTYVDGVEAWRFTVRRRVYSDADNQSVSEVLARRDDLAPLSSTIKHSIVGHFDAAYDAGKVRITTIGPDTTREETLDGRVFDNEQGFLLFRLLPLELDFKARMKFFSPVAGPVNTVQVEILETETITVPAGEFECYRMEFKDVSQTFWFSTDPNHYLVKLDAAGIVGELEKIYTRDPEESLPHVDNRVGFTVSVPPGWLHSPFDDQGTPKVVMLDPKADTRSVIRLHPSHGTCNSQAAAYRKLEDCEQIHQGFTLRQNSWHEREIDGRSAVSFIGNFREGENEVVQYWTYVDSGDYCVELEFKVHPDKLEDLREDFDAIVASYDGPRSTKVSPPDSPSAEAVKAVLSEFHLAASDANIDRYVASLSPDLTFLGTDRSERFDFERWATIARSSFATGNGWVSRPTEQNVFVSEQGTLAWFDERLESARFGEMRASGVLRREDGRWRIVQYNVGFPVPNRLVADLVGKIAEVDETIGEVPTEFSNAVALDPEDPAHDVKAALLDFHLAAAQADAKRYFGHLATDGVFFGTDRAERFTLEQMREFVQPYLSRGTGWSTVPFDQHVFFSPDGQLAWFEERLGREKIGEMRATGVMRRDDGEWKIVHYNLILPVPNELVPDLVEKIRGFYGPG